MTGAVTALFDIDERERGCAARKRVDAVGASAVMGHAALQRTAFARSYYGRRRSYY
jgi:hypothetical protein